MEKKRIRGPRKMLLVATAGLASVTLDGCWCTSGNLIAPPPCDDAGNYECPPPEDDAGGADDAGSTAGAGGTDSGAEHDGGE